MTMLKNSEIIETTKSTDVIREVISRYTDSYPDFWQSLTYKSSNPFMSKQGDNYISLRATNILLNWPFIELHLRDHIKPRLRIEFQGLYFFIVLYAVWLISFLVALSNVKTTELDFDSLIPMILYGAILIFIPYYAYRLQNKFRAWINQLLDEVDS